MSEPNAQKIVMERLAIRLKHLRGEMSQDEAAKKSGVSKRWIETLESGKAKTTGLDKLVKLANAYGSNLGEIFESFAKVRPAASTAEEEITYDRLRELLKSPYKSDIMTNIRAVHKLFEVDPRKSKA